MKTWSVLALAAVLVLPAAAAAAPAAEPGPWSLGVGLAVPAFDSWAGPAELPTYLVVSAPFRRAGWRVEPELGVGSGRYTVTRDLYLSSEAITDDGLIVRAEVPVTQRGYRVGVTVAPEWQAATAARLYAGGRIAAVLRRVAYVGDPDPEWESSFDGELGAVAGGELAFAPELAVGAALRFGWTALGLQEGGSDSAITDARGAFTGEALLSVRFGW